MDKLQKFIENKKVFRCPVCRNKLDVTPQGSFVCKKKHCFDISSKGYVNFITAQGSHQNKYSKELFECRSQVFAAGFYDKVLEEIGSVINDYFPVQEEAGKICILDVGCGEGFYAAGLNHSEPLADRVNVFALDIVKEAIQLACKERIRTSGEQKNKEIAGKTDAVKWIVGNLADIPLFNGTFDVLLDVLTPANYKEFQRLMKAEGILLKVIPGEDYLKEVRECVSCQLRNKDYTNDSTVAYFKENMELMEIRSVRYCLPISKEQAELFLQMTPMTFHVNTAELPEERIRAMKEITIHLEVLVGRKK